MKKIYLIVLICVSIICFFIIQWCMHNAPTSTIEEYGFFNSPLLEKIDTNSMNVVITSVQKVNVFEARVSADMEEKEESSIELMPLFQKDDTMEGMLEKGTQVYNTLLKNYERYLIIKFAPLNLTEEDVRKRHDALDSEEQRKENAELRDFGILWGWITRGDGHFSLAPPTAVDFTLRQGSDFFLRLDHMRAQLMIKLSEEEKNKAKFNDEQIEWLNHLIKTRKILAKDFGLPIMRSPQLSDEDKAFIEDAVKSNPSVKLPWRD